MAEEPRLRFLQQSGQHAASFFVGKVGGLASDCCPTELHSFLAAYPYGGSMFAFIN